LATQYTNIENATLTGAAALNLTGDDNNNVLIGNDGANKLDGGKGDDTMRGGNGGDTYYVDSLNDIVDETGTDKGIDLVNSSVSFDLSVDTPNSTHSTIENLTLTGGADINGTGNALVNVITGNSGANILDGGAGADTLTGGDGNDTYIVDNVGDKVTEAAGTTAGTSDKVVLVSGFATKAYSYTIGANIENLDASALGFNATITGNALDNKITTGAGNDTLDGGAGIDTLTGGAGNDTYILDNIGDTVVELANEGNDTVKTSVTGQLFANVENYIYTGKSNWTFDGSGAAIGVNITGGAGADNLTGGAFNDTLDGGAGIDTLTGGLGDD